MKTLKVIAIASATILILAAAWYVQTHAGYTQG